MYICMHVYVRMYVSMRVCVCACMCGRKCACIYARVCMYVCMHVRACGPSMCVPVHVSVRTPAQRTHARMYTYIMIIGDFVSVSVYACVHIYTYVYQHVLWVSRSGGEVAKMKWLKLVACCRCVRVCVCVWRAIHSHTHHAHTVSAHAGCHGPA